jgi:hypothetical protein
MYGVPLSSEKVFFSAISGMTLLVVQGIYGEKRPATSPRGEIAILLISSLNRSLGGR